MDPEESGRLTAGARADWEARIGRAAAGVAAAGLLAPPAGLRATPGRGQVTLDWDPVDGAVGYLVHRADGAGPLRVLDHHGGDVLAVPHPPYADTTGEPGRGYRYAVAALADVTAAGPPGPAVEAASLAGGAAEVTVSVDALSVLGELPRPWQPVIGAEHLSHLLSTDRSGGRPIGPELAEALRMAHEELGVLAVRAHGILCDDLGVYREAGGGPVYDFTGVDRVYDLVLGLGLRPVVELSFMPRDLARDPSSTVFAYRAIISPPKDWRRWHELVRSLVAHLVRRYGLAEVRDRWVFEVWNEPNLEVFWTGTRAEYLRLYDEAAAAVKAVHPDLRVGGPASAAGGWLGDVLRRRDGGIPPDFVSTHTYGSPPLDFRPLCARHGRPGLDVLWTEWGATPTHFNPVCDGVFAAALVLRGMRSAGGRVPALCYWVVSDHFEELGRPPALLHGGFGLLTVGNLRKPSYWALTLMNRLGPQRLAVSVAGDGAGSLVEALAARRDDGTVTVLVWNGTLDQSKAGGSALLGRDVRLTVRGLGGGEHAVRHWRVGASHSNIAAVWRDLGGRAGASAGGCAGVSAGGRRWPDEAQWSALRARDRLDEYAPELRCHGDEVRLDFPLPMPAVSCLEFTRVSADLDT